MHTYPFLSEILTKNVSFSSLAQLSLRNHFFGIAITKDFARASVNENLYITNVLMVNIC